jgi:hypothetical protein
MKCIIKFTYLERKIRLGNPSRSTLGPLKKKNLEYGTVLRIRDVAIYYLFLRSKFCFNRLIKSSFLCQGFFTFEFCISSSGYIVDCFGDVIKIYFPFFQHTVTSISTSSCESCIYTIKQCCEPCTI